MKGGREMEKQREKRMERWKKGRRDGGKEEGMEVEERAEGGMWERKKQRRKYCNKDNR